VRMTGMTQILVRRICVGNGHSRANRGIAAYPGLGGLRLSFPLRNR